MADVDFSLNGLSPVLDKLKGLPPRLQKKALRKGVRAGANIFRDAARSNVPVETGLTKRNIITVVSSKKDEVIGKVGVRGGGRNKGNNPYWWRFVELGFYHKNSGQYIKANPFMRNAQSQNIDASTNKVADAIWQEIESY